MLGRVREVTHVPGPRGQRLEINGELRWGLGERENTTGPCCLRCAWKVSGRTDRKLFTVAADAGGSCWQQNDRRRVLSGPCASISYSQTVKQKRESRAEGEAVSGVCAGDSRAGPPRETGLECTGRAGSGGRWPTRGSSGPLRHCHIRLRKRHSAARGGGSGSLAPLGVFATWTPPPPAACVSAAPPPRVPTSCH